MMTEKLFALVCAECHAKFDTAEGMMDHLLVTRHMDVPVNAESGAVQEFIEVLTMLQQFGGAGLGAELPSGMEIRALSEQDILDDDELSDEAKADILRKIAGIEVRRASDEEQWTALVQDARRRVAEGAGHECSEWVTDGVCALCDRKVAP
jgi:hypothetical protein